MLATPADYLMDVWTSDNGLPDSSVTSIAQTPDGYLWVGTYNGLARFDGVRFETFDPINTPQLKNARITGLFVDARGTLWINTYDGSLTSLRDGVFTKEWQGGPVSSVFSTSNQLLFTLAGHHSYIVCRTDVGKGRGEWSEIPLAGSVTGNSVEQDGSGTLWYMVKKDLYRMVGTNSERMPPATGYRGKSVFSMSVDAKGHLWIGTDEGIARWNHGHFENMTPTNGEPGVNVFSLYCTRNGCWVFGDGRVRKCVNRRWVAEVDAKAWRDLVGTFQLDLKAYQARNGSLWFTHLGSGLFHIRADGETEHWSAVNGLPSDLASCWFQDREGNIWVGLVRGGLVRLRERQFYVIGPAQGLGAPAVSSVCEDAKSNVWIGTFSGGLYRWRDAKLDRFTLPEGAYKECFFSVYPASEGGLWLSAGRENLYKMEDGKIVSSAIPVHGIKTILEDKHGGIWMGRPVGLAKLTDGVLINFPSTNGLNNIRSLAEGPHGGIWIGTGEGNLFHYHAGSFTQYQTDDGQAGRAIWSILPEADGTVWVGTVRGGLLRFKDGKFTRYSVKDGLPSDIICQILDDGMGKLWIGSHKGIFYVPKRSFHDFDAGEIQSLPCVAYGIHDGLPTLECSGNYQPACWHGADGRLWFATAKGLVWVRPDHLSVNLIPPPVRIEEIVVDGKPHHIAPGSQPFVIPPGKHQLDFHFTALSFTAPDKVKFRYQLHGVDQGWVDAGTKRLAHYAPLGPGKYRFQVIACNNDGIWNQTGAAISLVVEPHFWQTWWFDSLVIVVLLGSIIGAVRVVVTRKLHRKLEQMKQQQAIQRERERIAQDIHDDMGAGLTRILLQSALARRNPQEQTPSHLEQISTTAHELVGAMDEIVWAINPENDTLDGLVTYAGKFVQEYAEQAGLRCRLDLPAQVPAMHLSAEARHHLFLAVKEAMNNVVKHARATMVAFSLKLLPDGFAFMIKDDGCGFTPGTRPSAATDADRVASGHGLRNQVQRLEKIGGLCWIHSEPGEGTEVELTVMIQNVKQP